VDEAEEEDAFANKALNSIMTRKVERLLPVIEIVNEEPWEIKDLA